MRTNKTFHLDEASRWSFITGPSVCLLLDTFLKVLDRGSMACPSLAVTDRTAGFVVNFDRDRLGFVLLGGVLSRCLQRQVAARREVALDGLGIDVFGEDVASGELSLHVAAVVVRFLLVLSVDDDAVVLRLHRHLLGREVARVDVDGELVAGAGDRGTGLPRDGAARQVGGASPVARLEVEAPVKERGVGQLTAEKRAAEVVVEEPPCKRRSTPVVSVHDWEKSHPYQVRKSTAREKLYHSFHVLTQTVSSSAAIYSASSA